MGTGAGGIDRSVNVYILVKTIVNTLIEVCVHAYSHIHTERRTHTHISKDLIS